MTEQQNRVAAQAMVDADAVVWSGWLDVVMSIISPVFAQARSRWVAFDYVWALLAEGRRSCWQLAELAGHDTPRRLQALLAEYVWDAQVLAERVRALLVEALADPDAVLAIDETAELKAGEQTVGVAPQYAGITGQVENCPDGGVPGVCDRPGARVDGLHVVPAQDVDRRLAPAGTGAGA